MSGTQTKLGMGLFLTSVWDDADVVFDSCFNNGFHVFVAPWPDDQVWDAANLPRPQGKQLTAGVTCKGVKVQQARYTMVAMVTSLATSQVSIVIRLLPPCLPMSSMCYIGVCVCVRVVCWTV